MGAIHGLLFDKDGTLYDFNATWGGFMRGVLAEEAAGDADLAEALAAILGLDTATGRFAPGSVAVAGTTLEIAAALAPMLPGPPRLSDLAARLDARAAAVPLAPATDLVPFLDGLAARGFVLGVATNDSEAPARAHLAASGILDRFAFVAGADSGHGAKPGPGQLAAFCAATGLAPGAVAMVGDSAHDLLAAQAAGMVRVGVLTGLATEADLAPLADAVLPSIAALPAWLAARGA